MTREEDIDRDVSIFFLIERRADRWPQIHIETVDLYAVRNVQARR